MALLVVLEFVRASRPPSLPPVLAVSAARSSVAAPPVLPVTVPGVIFARPLFAPRQSMVADAATLPPPVLGGATIAGSVSVRGRSYAVVRRANGRIVNLPVGGAVNGWRLAALVPEGAIFSKGGKREIFAYGAQPVVDAGTEAVPSE